MAKKKKPQTKPPKPEPKPEPKPPKPVPPKPKPRPRPMRKGSHTNAGCILGITLFAALFAGQVAFETWAVLTTQVSTGAATWCTRLDGQQEGLGTLTTWRYLSCAYDTIDGPMMNAITSSASTGFRILGARFAKQAIMGVEDGRFVEDGPLLIEAAEIWSWLYPKIQFPFSTATLIEVARNFALGEPDLRTQLDLDRIACPNCNWGWETVDCLLSGLIEGQLGEISGMAYSNRLQDALKLLRLAIVCLKLLKAVKKILEDAKRAEALAKASGAAEATAAHEKGLQEVRALVLRQEQEVREALKVESWQLHSSDVVLKHVGRLNRDTVTVIESRAAEVRLVLTGSRDIINLYDTIGSKRNRVHVGGGSYCEAVRKFYKHQLALNSYDGEKEGLRVINRERVAMFDALAMGPLEVVVRPAACTASRALGGVALFCSPANRHGLMRFILRKADILKSPDIVVDRPELDSPLARLMVIVRLAVMADLGRLGDGVPPLDELGLDEFAIQARVRHFCVTSGQDAALIASVAYQPVWKSISELGYTPRHRADAVTETTSRRWRGTVIPSSRFNEGDGVASTVCGAQALISTQVPGLVSPRGVQRPFFIS